MAFVQIDALPEVVRAVKGSNVEVYLDGGVRLGTDVLKALALGARAVFIGRPVLWGLTYKVIQFCAVLNCCVYFTQYFGTVAGKCVWKYGLCSFRHTYGI